jgi:hypothetical protein
MVARMSRYEFPPGRLTEIGERLRTVVRGRQGGYDPRILAACLGVDRESGRSVAVTIASDEEALAHTPAEPEGAEAMDAALYDVPETYVAAPERFDTYASPRLHLLRGEARREQDELVGAAFALTRAAERPLLVAFAEWPEWVERVGGADVYDLEYFMIRHGAPVR